MGEKGTGVERLMSRQEAARYLRKVADQLESGTPADEPASDPAIGDFKKLKIGLKNRGEQVEMKIKVKPTVFCDEAGSSPEKGEKSAYKALKKKMKSDFKAIRESLVNGGFPLKETVGAFLRDSEQMVAYPGYGDAYYAEYQTACGRFQSAFEGGDLPGCQAACQELDRLKKACHDRYK